MCEAAAGRKLTGVHLSDSDSKNHHREEKKNSKRKNKDVMKHNFINVNSQRERKIVCSQINEGIQI